jgi:hypothetical protein
MADIGIEDTTAQRWGNQPSRCEAWQFGLIEIRVAELARCFSATCEQARPARLRCSRRNAARAKLPHPAMMHRTTVLRQIGVDTNEPLRTRLHTIREVLLPQ